MDLLVKTVILAVVIAILLVSAYFLIPRISAAPPVTEQQAIAAVESDISDAYPTAYANITNVTPSAFPGSWHIVASVIFNSTKPCPSYYVWSFDYPKYGFINRVDNIYTSNCTVYGMLQNKSYILASYPAAITASYDIGLKSIKNFIGKYGYANMFVHAKFYNATSIMGENYTRVWLVNYSAINSNYSEYVLISQIGGKLLLNYTVAR